MLGNFDQGIHPEAEHTSFYNDPDMMVVGMPGFSDAQNWVHMSLWAISGAPLLVGADLAKLSPATATILTNPAVLAIDQDPLGLQAVQAAESGPGLETWSKTLATPGRRAVLLLNRTTAPAAVSFHLSGLALLDSAFATNLWTGKDLRAIHSGYSATVPAGDAILLLVQGREAPFTTYKHVPATAHARRGLHLCRRIALHGAGPGHLHQLRQQHPLCRVARQRWHRHAHRLSAHRSRPGLYHCSMLA